MVEKAVASMEGFECLHREISPDVYALAFSLLLDHDDSEEAYSEVMVRLYRHLQHLNDLDAFGGWAVRIVVNTCRTVQAKRSQLLRTGALGAGHADSRDDLESGPILVPDYAPGPRDIAASHELARAVNEAMSTLPPRQRESLLLFEIWGYSLSEVATAMGCTTGAVKFHLHEGRRKLREILAPWMDQEALP
jgi:RNA polymerase sigma-70 factor (ECF subfamily)